jgi:hypothetical protein
LERTGGNRGGLGGASETTGFLRCRLLEVKLDLEWTTGGLAVLLTAVDIGDDVIMLHHLGLFVVLK